MLSMCVVLLTVLLWSMDLVLLSTLFSIHIHTTLISIHHTNKDTSIHSISHMIKSKYISIHHSYQPLHLPLPLPLQFLELQLGRDKAVQDRLFLQLLGVFEDKVLYTYRSKFVQFIYFYVCCRVERFSTAFCHRLLRVFLDQEKGGAIGGGGNNHNNHHTEDPNQNYGAMCLVRETGMSRGVSGTNSMKLQSAVLYLASFLARATFVPLALVSDCIHALLHWANEYVRYKSVNLWFSMLHDSCMNE